MGEISATITVNPITQVDASLTPKDIELDLVFTVVPVAAGTGDLDITLIAPDGTILDLFTSIDLATVGTLIDVNTFRLRVSSEEVPNLLSVLVAGNWTLIVRDNALLDLHTLVSATLELVI